VLYIIFLFTVVGRAFLFNPQSILVQLCYADAMGEHLNAENLDDRER
jgi:hypothetical protein